MLNGKGNVTSFNNSIPLNQTKDIPTRHTIQFDLVESRPKRYLLRLLNTAFDTDFIFSIDNHVLTVIGMDFVPVYGNVTQTTIFVAIGQRYNVIVEAKPQPDGSPLPTDEDDMNFWIRTYTGSDRRKTVCPNNIPFLGTNGTAGYEKLGILRYGTSKKDPTSQPWSNPNDSYNCDEDYFRFTPTVPWRVELPIANDPSGVGENFTVGGPVGQPNIYPLATWSLGATPLYVDYSNPTFLKLNYTGPLDPLWNVYPETSESKWVSRLPANVADGLGDRKLY